MLVSDRTWSRFSGVVFSMMETVRIARNASRLRRRLNRKTRRDRMWRWLAHKMPKRLVYFCAIRLAAHATTSGYSSEEVPALLFMDALQRWEK